MRVDGRGVRHEMVFPRLVRVLEWQGRSNSWLAAAGGTSVSYLWKVMTGQSVPEYPWKLKVALLLGVPIELLFPEEESGLQAPITSSEPARETAAHAAR